MFPGGIGYLPHALTAPYKLEIKQNQEVVAKPGNKQKFNIEIKYFC